VSKTKKKFGEIRTRKDLAQTPGHGWAGGENSGHSVLTGGGGGVSFNYNLFNGNHKKLVGPVNESGSGGETQQTIAVTSGRKKIEKKEKLTRLLYKWPAPFVKSSGHESKGGNGGHVNRHAKRNCRKDLKAD